MALCCAASALKEDISPAGVNNAPEIKHNLKYVLDFQAIKLKMLMERVSVHVLRGKYFEEKLSLNYIFVPHLLEFP